MQSKNSSIKGIQDYYKGEAAVAALGSWYVQSKERAFLDHVLNDLSLPSNGPVVEIGGGAGLQGILLKERFGDRYLHTDYSEPLVLKAREFGLTSEVVDGLSMPFDDASVAALILVGPSTIVNDEPTRHRQFQECARVLMAGAPVVMVTSRIAARTQRHCLDKDDLATMGKLGLKPERSLSWGVIPGRFWRSWNRVAFFILEKAPAAANLGMRRVVIARRVAD